MDATVITAIVAGFATVAVAVIGVYRNEKLKVQESKDRRAWDIREEKKRVYARFLAEVGRTVGAYLESPASAPSPRSSVTQEMANWSSGQVFIRYLQFRVELEQKTPRMKKLRTVIAELVLDIRADLEHEDESGIRDEQILEALGEIIYMDSLGKPDTAGTGGDGPSGPLKRFLQWIDDSTQRGSVS